VFFKHGLGRQTKPEVFNISTERPDKNLVAVMMPFGATFDPVYAKLKEVIEVEGLECKFFS